MLAGSVAACSSAERLTTGMKVRNAVVKLGEQPAATVVASVDATPGEAREFLRQARSGDGKSLVSELDARRLAGAELTVSAGTGNGEEETPLKEMPASEAASVAAALNFGGKDAIAVKSVDDQLYLRVRLKALAKQAEASEDARARASEIVDLADDLPETLRPASDALKGEWVRADPDAFDDFARAAETLAERQWEQQKDDGEKKNKGDEEGRKGGDGKGRDDSRAHAELSREIRDAVTIGSALEGQPQREFVANVQDLLREHAEFDARGERGGAEHVRMTLPGDEAASDLVEALRSLGAEIDPDRIPKRDVAADLSIRRGQLTSLTLDLGQFTEGDARLPLRLQFGGGDAVAVTAPSGTEKLQPQDLMAAWMYGALGTERF